MDSNMNNRKARMLETQMSKSMIFGDVLRNLNSHTRQNENNPLTSAAAENDLETKEEFKLRLIHLLNQMMFVSGETAEPSAETTWMIEEIVREQVLEMVCPSTTPSRRD